MLVIDNLLRRFQRSNPTRSTASKPETPDSSDSEDRTLVAPKKQTTAAGFLHQRCHRRFPYRTSHLHHFSIFTCLVHYLPMCNTLPSSFGASLPPAASRSIQARLCKGWDGVLIREPLAATIWPACRVTCPGRDIHPQLLVFLVFLPFS